METDILLEGFVVAERVHGFRSSVIVTVLHTLLSSTMCQAGDMQSRSWNVLTTCASAIMESLNK